MSSNRCSGAAASGAVRDESRREHAGRAARGAAGRQAVSRLHVVMRVVPAVGSLRRRDMYKAMEGLAVAEAIRESPSGERIFAMAS
jgi:hypothetical protein